MARKRQTRLKRMKVKMTAEIRKKSIGKFQIFRLEVFFNPYIFEPYYRTHREDKKTSYKLPPKSCSRIYQKFLKALRRPFEILQCLCIEFGDPKSNSIGATQMAYLRPVIISKIFSKKFSKKFQSDFGAQFMKFFDPLDEFYKMAQKYKD